MNNKQLEIMEMKINPSFKLTMIAMLQWPEANRKQLSAKMNIDNTQLTNTSKKMIDAGLIKKYRVEDSVNIRYEVLV